LLFRRALQLEKSVHVAYNYTLMLLSQQRSDEAAQFWLSFRQGRRMAPPEQQPVPRAGGVVCCARAGEAEAVRMDAVMNRLAKNDVSHVLQMF